MNWEQFFKLMVIDERAAKAKYEAALAVADNAEVRAILERLRDEEAFHVDFLEESWSRLRTSLDKKA
jgi:rubrerythrin